jgi:hypothetical protein
VVNSAGSNPAVRTSAKLVSVSVQIGPPARVPFRSAGCNPADCETVRRASRGSNSSGTHHNFVYGIRTMITGKRCAHDHHGYKEPRQ